MAPFCSCPASLVSRKFFAVGPGCAKCFLFCCAPLGAATFRRGQSKKNTTQGVFFVLRPRGKAGEGEAPCRHGARAKKKHHPGCFFFCCGPGERQGKEKPRWAPARGQSKKKNTTQGVVFFAPAPGKGRGRRSPVGRRHGAAAKKKHPGWCFFFFALAPCRHGLLLPLPFPGAGAKKKTPWVVFLFLLRPRADAHSLTAGLGGDASPSPGWCFFFCCGPARTGVVFFVLLWPRPDSHSLTVGWGDFGKARVVLFFFCCGPAGVFLDNSKKCLGYYIGSKKTRRGHSKKKNTTSLPEP